MPEETTTDTEQSEQAEHEPAEASGIVHDDIMQRLLEYQRQLREGTTESADTPTAAETVQVVDITEAEAELEAAEGSPEDVGVTVIEETAEAVEAEVREIGEDEPAEELFSTSATEAPSSTWAETPKGPEPETPKDESHAAEAPEAASPAPETEGLEARVTELEDALARVSAMVAELRARFQDMAIAADERLAAIEETLSGVGSPNRN